ncbi:MAG: cation:proton antiporter [Actinomycetes bacterium]
MAGIAVFALVVVMYTAFSRRFASWNLSAAIVFAAAGTVFGIGHIALGIDAAMVRTIAEATLAMILFHDAAHLHPRQLLADKGVLLRLLLIGLPLTIALGWVVARLLFPEAGVWLALFVASALAPTDAGLGAATVLNPVVPARIRRILNGESGLNDGLATPIVLFALAASANAPAASDVWHAVGEALLEIAIGGVIGVAAGFGAGWLMKRARDRQWAIPALVPVSVAVIPIVAYFGASLLHGNGFIAAFVAGTALAAVGSAHHEEDLVTTESVSTLLGYAVWGLFGVIFVAHLGEYLTWHSLVFALLALTVFRILPVWLVLWGTGFASVTKGFIGWFGPRGLASVVFALIAFEELGGVGVLRDATGVVGVTVLLSVIAHGITGTPWASAYGRWVQRTSPVAEMAEP